MIPAAVVTTGGTVDGEFAAAIGTRRKALATVRGQTMLERTLDALRAAGIEEIALIGDDEVRSYYAARVERFFTEANDGARNQLLALRAWGEDRRVLYATSDMPYITGAALRKAIADSDPDALTLPLAEYADFTARFPGAPPFGITLAGERVVNCGVFLIPPRAARTVERVAAAMFDARKSPLRMARIAGLPLLLRILMRRLRIADVEARASRVLGVPARALRGAAPELAYDTDTLEEFTYAATHR